MLLSQNNKIFKIYKPIKNLAAKLNNYLIVSYKLMSYSPRLVSKIQYLLLFTTLAIKVPPYT